MTKQMYHSVHRTSPKGVPFIGRCVQCGLEGLPASTALDECPNPKGIDSDTAVINAIMGDDSCGRDDE